MQRLQRIFFRHVCQQAEDYSVIYCYIILYSRQLGWAGIVLVFRYQLTRQVLESTAHGQKLLDIHKSSKVKGVISLEKGRKLFVGKEPSSSRDLVCFQLNAQTAFTLQCQMRLSFKVMATPLVKLFWSVSTSDASKSHQSRGL